MESLVFLLLSTICVSPFTPSLCLVTGLADSLRFPQVSASFLPDLPCCHVPPDTGTVSPSQLRSIVPSSSLLSTFTFHPLLTLAMFHSSKARSVELLFCRSAPSVLLVVSGHDSCSSSRFPFVGARLVIWHSASFNSPKSNLPISSKQLTLRSHPHCW